MSDPKIIEIEPGEPEEVISERDAKQGIPYIVEVSGDNPVRYAHNKRYADQGATLSAGQSHTLSNFRGKAIYLAAFNGATSVRAFPAGAEFDSQPQKEVIVEGSVSIDSDVNVTDRAGREIGKARMQDSGGTLIDPATSNDVTGEQPREVATWSAGTLSTDPGTVAVEAANGPSTDRTTATGASNAAALQLGERESVDVAYDLAGDATVTVEVRRDGGNWHERESNTYSGEGVILISTAFTEIRAYADSNLNEIEVAGQ